VKVHYSEGVATHTGPKPCVVIREDGSEASAGERAGQPLNRERKLLPDADAVGKAEGNTDGRVSASAPTIRRGRRHWHARKLLAREPGDLATDQCGTPQLVRIGKVRSRSR
jgi:hypothetical protein